MEHSLLHALQLAGIITALGGTFFVLFFLHPARRDPTLAMLAGEWERISASWSFWAASLGALGTIIDIFVQVAEIRGATIYGGVNPEDIFKFATGTVVGQIACAKAMFLICLAGSLKWNGKFRWVCALVLGIAASVTSSLVSHSAALPVHRTAAITAQISHIIMGSAWIGVLIQLFAGRNFFTGNTPITTAKLLAFILKRFSPIAITALTLIVFSGFYAVWRFLQTPMAALNSPYGLTLSLKLVLLLIVLRAGWVNWQIARPAILQITKDPAELFTKKGESIFAQFSRTLELEVTAGLLVITVAGILGGIAPPGEEGLYRLNRQEMSALATPDLPTTRIVDPAKFVGANERTLDDLRYAEFTHNWSGIIVLLLGICWLAQSSSRQGIFSRLWPLLLVPFGFFIAVAADPEIWILRNVSVLQVLRDPQLIEHQIGAALVFLLVWFGWRDAKRSKETQPLGYTLPILMVCGSLMLLGHAHTNLAGTEQLGTMINVEHAIFGTLGLFAGITRWFQLRSLIPENMARICWPMCVITLGVYMAFFYREAL